MPEKAKALGNALDRDLKFVPHRKVADFWRVFNDKST
jgi:hypothetical protein